MITIRQYAPNETIINENDIGETAFIIEKGKVEVYKERNGARVHVAILEAGASFGEMSLVYDSPRSATVTALEETLVREYHRDAIVSTMKENPEAIIKFLKNIFERLRDANAKIAKLESQIKHPESEAQAAPAALPKEPFKAQPAKAVMYTIEGMTPKASEAMSDDHFAFSTFPLKVGRKSNDPLVNNHLEIADQDPLQISRHHVSIIKDGDKIGVIDRGSHLGALVDGIRIGGKKGAQGPAYFQEDGGILVLGTDASPYRYRIRKAG
jgi:CRP/FNR family transcriptional regulator, cyclic AMP receptor protein